MVFKVDKASDWKYESTIEINTLEDLINFAKEVGSELVFNADEMQITIYDDYLE